MEHDPFHLRQQKKKKSLGGNNWKFVNKMYIFKVIALIFYWHAWRYHWVLPHRVLGFWTATEVFKLLFFEVGDLRILLKWVVGLRCGHVFRLLKTPAVVNASKTFSTIRFCKNNLKTWPLSWHCMLITMCLSQWWDFGADPNAGWIKHGFFSCFFFSW